MNFAAHPVSAYARRGISKAAYVYEDLRASIIGLELKPGIRIDKTEVCERLHVSRQPLAEAIARLADERLVEVEPQKGTFVARIRLADVSEAAFVRRALEIATVEAIAASMDEATLNRLDRILGYQAAAVKAKDTEEFYALDVRFHTMLFERLAMRRVAEVVETSRANWSAPAGCFCRRRAAIRTPFASTVRFSPRSASAMRRRRRWPWAGTSTR